MAEYRIVLQQTFSNKKVVMKNILKLGLLGLLSIMMITSCEEDPLGGGGGTTPPGTGGTGDLAPTVSFGTDAGFLSADATVAPGEIFTVQLISDRGTAALNALTINENGERLVDFSNRITINGQAAPAAALLLQGADKESFVFEIAIKAQEDRSANLYQFLVEDEGGLSAAIDIEINTELTGDDANPEVNLLGNENIIADAGSLVCLNLEVIAANADLETILVVDQAGATIAPDRVFFGSSSAADQLLENPSALPIEDARGFNKQVCIRAHADQSEQDYTIAVTDTRDSFDFVTVTINTFPGGVDGQPVTELRGVLFNRAGPAGTGGLDLDSGAGTGSSDTSAELIDNGIDNGQGAGTNWFQRISGTNNTTLRQLIPNQNGLPETFTFDGVATDVEIADAWVNGIALQSVNSNGEPWTEVVQPGDLYIAMRDGKLYVMEITEVFVDPTSNGDFYEMDIKF